MVTPTKAKRSGNTTASGSGRSRSFGGCHTCRRRHVKCDERQPTCRQCDRVGVSCGGYSKNIIFDFELAVGGHVATASSETTTQRFRRPLLSENERRRMSKRLMSWVPPGSTTSVLQRLDNDAEELLAGLSPSGEIALVRGPFGAFEMTKPNENAGPALGSIPRQESRPPEEERGSIGQVLESMQGLVEADNNQDHDTGSWGFPNWPTYLDSFSIMGQDGTNGTFPTSSEDGDNLNVNNSSQAAFSRLVTNPFFFTDDEPTQLACDEENETHGQDQDTQGLLSGTAAGHHLPSCSDLWDPGEFDRRVEDMLLTQDDLYSQSIGVPTVFPDFMEAHDNSLLAEAVPLLKHYTTTVIASMSPFRHSNTPWHVLFLAQLKTCLATLVLREVLDETQLTTFYGSLAVSALSLGTISQSSMWNQNALQYRRQACRNAFALLTKPRTSPNGSMSADEYESMLIALLTMAQMSIFLGDRVQTEGFLLEVEKLVRLRGLTKKKSRKIRLLHHCYVYMRLFHESTCIASGMVESNHRRLVRQAVESSGVTGSTDNLSFRLLQWNDLVFEMTVMKDQEEGENDLHIARPGLFPTTMYPEIFGLPESVLFLLSQTIRLGNEKDLAERDNPTGPTSLRDFTRRAKAIERGINELQSRSGSLIPDTNKRLILPTILDGLQSALAIYFYRRIYNLHSKMLQPQVTAVRDWLDSYDQANPDVLQGSFGLVWPAFVAACEADGRHLRHSFRQWFCKAARRTGLVCITENLRVIEKVWEARSGCEGSDSSVNWLDVLRGDSSFGQQSRQTVGQQAMFMNIQ